MSKIFTIQSTIELSDDWDVIRLGTTMYSLLCTAKKHAKLEENVELLDRVKSKLHVDLNER